MLSPVRFVLLLLLFVPALASAQLSPYTQPWPYALPACRIDPYTLIVRCEPAPIVESESTQRYAIGEGIIGVPGRERGWLVLLNLDTVPRLAQVDYLLGGADTVYRLTRHLKPLSRESIAIHEDPLFRDRAVAFSVVVLFEGAGAVHLVTRPADNLWRAETIVAGIRIGGAQ